MDEKHSINCQSPYAASKASADQLALSFYRSFNLPVKIIRPFNTYGPRQSNRAIIPTIINQCLKNKKGNIVLGNLKPKRDLNYVEDVSEAFFEIYKKNKLIGEVVNVGSNTNISVEELARKIFRIMKVDCKIKSSKIKIRPKSSEVYNLKCQNKKIIRFTNWKSKTNLETGLKKTIQWIKSNQAHYSDIYTI